MNTKARMSEEASANLLETLVDELKERRTMTKDYIVSPELMHIADGKLQLAKDKQRIIYTPTKLAHSQLASKLAIPQAYYDRMLNTHPELLDESVNVWLSDKQENYFVRTFESSKKGMSNVFRALLSDNYKVMDNYDVLNAFFEAIYASQVKVEIVTASTTDQRLYIKVVAKNIQMKADNLLKTYRNPLTGTHSPTAMIGIEMTNSEVGKGAFQLMPFLQFDCCMNRLKIMDNRLRKIHLGAQMEGGEEWSNRTDELNSQLIVSQVRDSVEKFMSMGFLERSILSFDKAAGHQLKHPLDAVNNVVKLGGYSDERRDAVLDYFVKGGDSSAFGIIQALTFEAHTLPTEDEVYDAENFAATVAPSVITHDRPFSAN